MALGADNAVLLSDPAFDGSGGYATARTLAETIRTIGDVDLVLTGRQAADWDAGVVGAGIAELLDLPAITFARTVRVADGKVTVGAGPGGRHRDRGGGPAGGGHNLQ